MKLEERFSIMSKLVSSLVFWTLIPGTAFAQITPDSSLGEEEKSVVDTNANRDTINGGAVRNANLFHSFQEFNVGAGREAYFSNPDGIANIFSRVTGNNFSNIQGVLGVLGNANLYLINPNGILFGENARLDVNGSFFASTADSVWFDNGFEFSALNPDAPPLLTIDIPIGLRFRDNRGDIVNQSVANNGNGLQVATGETITLVGGNVTLDGGIIFAPGGRVELGGLLAAGEIGLNEDGSLSFPERVARGDVSLTNDSDIGVLGGGGGSITVNARNFELLGSSLLAGIDTDLGSPDAQAGEIKIDATDNVLIDGQSNFTTISNSVFENSIGNAGKINISARNISLTNGGGVDSFVSGRGNTSEINLNARENILIDGNNYLPLTSVRNSVTESGVGNSGRIEITAQNLIVTNGGQIESDVSGRGNGGDINIEVRDSLSVEGEAILAEGIITSQIDTSVNSVEGGNSGDINITTSRLSLTNGGQINANNFGRGKPGNINITATESITLNRRSRRGGRFSGISSIVISGAVGNGGNIQITTEDFSISNEATIDTSTAGRGNGGKINITATNLSLTNGGDIGASTFGRDANELTEGNAGDITLNVAETLSISGSAGIFSSNLGNTIGNAGKRIGNAGKIDITASKLSLSNSSQINSFTRGRGNAGSITINAADSVVLDTGNELEFPTIITTAVDEGGVGNGGEINIKTNNLSILNGARIENSTLGEGDAGNITINARDAIFLSGQDREGFPSGIFSGVRETARGNGGTVNITTNNLSLFDGAGIFVGSIGQGNGGDIFIQANSLNLERDSELRAATSFGTGGNIKLQLADTIFLGNNSSISARATNNADGGNINIDAKFIIAFPNQNNDIIASAERGTGGNIDITAEAIFGIEERKAIPPNETNDIDASSQFGFSGTVNITQPSVDPASGLVDLTQEVVDPAKLIAQNVCQQTANSEFVDIGKGGLPQNPEYVLAEDTIEVGLVAPIITSSEATEPVKERIEVKPKITRKPPAQGWIFHENGIVELVAYNPHQVGEQRTWDNHRGCQEMNVSNN